MPKTKRAKPDKGAVQAPKGVRYFDHPMLVRHAEATRFLWGDDVSQQVSDFIYGRNERVASLIYALRPGGYFKSSTTWKSMFDQHRFYYVLQGHLTIHDPESGEVAQAVAGEAIYWRGAKWHFGYNFSQQETVVLDWYAPQERPPTVPEVEFGKTKPALKSIKNGRYELIGNWPAAMLAERRKALAEGGLVTIGRRDALHLIHGDERPIVESLYISTDQITAGVVDLMPGTKADPQSHPSDKIILVTAGRLNVYLPDSYDWFEANPRDCLFLPGGTRHQYWNYSDAPTSFAFSVVPRYR